MRFRFLVGDMNWETYGGSFVSRRLNNGEFDCWLVLEVIPSEEDASPRYQVSLNVVAPSQCPLAEQQAALRSWGMADEDLEVFFRRFGDLGWVEILHSYGVRAQLWAQSGNNLRQLLRTARQEADKVEMLFGFYMDRPQNALGANGWDLIQGNVWGRSFHVENA
jgi:hypothetical protein